MNSIGSKLVLAFSFFIVLIVAQIGVNQYVSSKIKFNYNTYKNEIEPVLQILEPFKYRNKELELLTLGKVKNGFDFETSNRIKGLIEVELPFYKSELHLNANIFEKNKAIEELTRCFELIDQIIFHEKEIQNTFLLKTDFQNPEKVQFAQDVVQNRLLPLFFELDNILYETLRKFNRDYQTYQSEVTHNLEELNFIIWSSGLLGILGGLMVGFRTYKSIVNPIEKLKGIANSIAKGDYSVPTKIKGAAEVQLLFNSFVSMSESLERGFKLLEEKSEDLERSRKRLRMILNSANEAIVVTDQSGNINLWNASASRMFGWQNKEVLGKPIEAIFPYMHDQEFKHQIEEAINEKKGLTIEVVGLTKETEEIPLEISITKWKGLDGTEFSYIGRDISERKRVAQELKSYNSMLEKKNIEMEQFTYIVSHDLKEPLRTISNFTNLIAQNHSKEFDVVAQKGMEYILDATSRMNVLIEELLEHSRIGSNAVMEPLDLNKTIQLVIDDLHGSLNEVGGRITVGKLPTLVASKIEIHLLFQNLLSNAIKFRKKDRPLEIKVWAEDAPDFVWFHIQDNGIGIKKNNLDKVFGIFQRLNTGGEYEGTGIGLAHCSKVVAVHKGEIKVESIFGEGSTFSFSIAKDI